VLARIAVALALLVALAGPAHAQDVDPLEGWFVRLHRAIVVQADGSFVETIDDEMAVDPVDGDAPRILQRVLHWNASAGSIEIVEAATVKPDGRRVPAPPDMMFEDQVTGRGGLFQDQRFVVVSFIDFERGDRVLLRAVHRRTVPFFPGQFFEARVAPRQPVHDMRVSYDVPATMELHHEAVGFEAVPRESAPGRRVYEWRLVGRHPPLAEHRVVAPTDYADRLFVSTLADNRALARAYLQDAYPMADPTAQIRELAQEVTRSARTVREKARALHEWVRSNVAYGGEYLGRASVVPRPAQRTLAELEGDCKDHATLYEALLSAVGIDSSPVMVNATNAYALPRVPTLAVFNHVMTWIPSLQQFVDASALAADFGELPVELADKPVLIVKTGEVSRTPPLRPGEQSIALEARLDRAGSARLRLTETTRGWLGATRRRAFESADDLQLERAAFSLLRASRLDGRAILVDESGQGDADASRMRLEAEATGATIEAVEPRLRALSSVGVGIESALRDFAPFRRHAAPSICVPARVDEHARWELPAGLAIAAVPPPVAIDGAGFRYRAQYRVAGGVLEIRRSLRLDFDSNVCSPERFRTVQRLAGAVFDDLEASVRLRRRADAR